VLKRSICLRKKYLYKVVCPSCNEGREVTKKSSTGFQRCHPCAGKQTYVEPSSERKDKRSYGDGYITKQGYHLIYDGSSYVPAHRLKFKGLDKDIIIHHIDGNKINNDLTNLYPCSKQVHREIHGQLERISYYLVQNGHINFEEGKYTLSTSMKKFIDENSVNSGKPLSVDAEGNPEPSPLVGRCNDYPEKEYTQVSGSTEDPNGL
jgi:hypothetical protein